MREKLSMEEFLKRKEALQNLFQQRNEELKGEKENPNFDHIFFETEFMEQYYKMEQELLSYDLSEIPFEAWENIRLYSNQEYPLNFEGTFANIDFDVVNVLFVEQANFKSCKIQNAKEIPYRLRKEENFDQDFIEKNDIFLSSSFDEEIKNKILNGSITMEEIVHLKDEEIQELSDKEYDNPDALELRNMEDFYGAERAYEKVYLSSSFSMIEAIGFQKACELYRYSSVMGKEVEALIKRMMYNDKAYHIGYGTQKDFNNYLKESKIEDILALCDERMREDLLYSYQLTIKPTDYTERFLEKNEDIFLLKKDLPDEIREKYYKKELKWNDVLNYLDVFINISFEKFLARYGSEQTAVLQMQKDYGEENFKKLLKKYPEVFKNIPINTIVWSLSNLGNTDKKMLNYEERFYERIKEYLLEKRKNDLHQLPEYFSSMNFKVVDTFHSVEEFKQYDKHTILCDNEQRHLLEKYGITNFLTLLRETNLFTSSKTGYTIENFDHYMEFYKNSRKRIYYPNFSYDEFEREIAWLLRKNRYNIDYSFLDENFQSRHKMFFIDKYAPLPLQEVFYHDDIHSNFLKEHKEYIPFLKGKSIYVLFDHLLDIIISNITITYGSLDGFDLLLQYEPYLNNNNKEDQVYYKYKFKSKSKLTKKKLLEILEEIIKMNIDKGMKYDQDMPSHFKDKYPNFFVDDKLPEDIKNKFYQKKLSLSDFAENINLLEQFKNINIIYGFPSQFIFLRKLFPNDSEPLANLKRLKILPAYEEALKMDLTKALEEYIHEENYNIDNTKVNELVPLLHKITISNADEIQAFRHSFAKQLLKSDAPMDSLEQMEEVFIKNNLPMVGKIFRCFQILYPNLEEFNFHDKTRMAPMLQDSNLPKVGSKNGSPTDYRFTIIYNDLIRNAVKSGNRDLIFYLSNLEEGSKLLDELEKKEKKVSSLNRNERQTLDLFLSHLEILYKNTEKGRNDKIEEESLEEKLSYYKQKMDVTSRYDLKDRIVRSFAYFAGYPSYISMREDIKNTIEDANKRNKERAKELETKKFKLEKGDFLRSIGDFKVLGSSLNSGNYSKEYLATFTNSSKSDTTPLDVDFSRIEENYNIYDAIKGTPTGFGFGNVYVVLRKDNPNLVITRDNGNQVHKVSYDPKKLEMFQTGYDSHYGLRTGFSFTDVDYILYKKNLLISNDQPYDEFGNVCYIGSEKGLYDDLNTIKFELARNGLYIPVVDFSGKLIYTEEEYQDLREKMDGLSYYGTKEYHFSDHLVNEEIEEIVGHLKENEKETKEKEEKIDAMIENALSVYNKKTGSSLTLKREIDGDLTPSSIELIDTGSTNRGTNAFGEGDFDFLLRVDRELLEDEEKYKVFKSTLREELTKYGISKQNETPSGDFRYKGIETEDGTLLDVDISFAVKTNKIAYSTDACLKDRLDTIRSQDEEKYQYVVGNILLAKHFFKENYIYKPKRSDETQGGMGGSGIENWVLQHGGSFYDAAKSFVEASKNKNFEEFKATYTVWDFGENHFAERNKEKTIEEKRGYLHDNFIADNMNALGYSNMVEELNQYVMEQDKKQTLEGKVK